MFDTDVERETALWDYSKWSLLNYCMPSLSGHYNRLIMLQELVSSVEGFRFEIEDALDKQLGARPLPFPGMDSK